MESLSEVQRSSESDSIQLSLPYSPTAEQPPTCFTKQEENQDLLDFLIAIDNNPVQLEPMQFGNTFIDLTH